MRQMSCDPDCIPHCMLLHSEAGPSYVIASIFFPAGKKNKTDKLDQLNHGHTLKPASFPQGKLTS